MKKRNNLVCHSALHACALAHWSLSVKPCTLAANVRRWPHAGLLLGQRRRRWTTIKPALGQSLVSVWRTGHSEINYPVRLQEGERQFLYSISKYIFNISLSREFGESFESMSDLTIQVLLMRGRCSGCVECLSCRSLWLEKLRLLTILNLYQTCSEWVKANERPDKGSS